MTPSLKVDLTIFLVVLSFVSPSACAETPARFDGAGDPLPAHALARLGTTRWRQQWSIVSLSYSKNGKVLACGSYEDGISVFDAASGRKLRHLAKGADSIPVFVAVSADGRRVAAFQPSGLRVFDAGNGKVLSQLTLPANEGINGIVLSADGTHLVTVPWKGVARLWNVDSGKQLAVFPRITAAAFADDGKTLLLGNEKRVRIWDVSPLKERGRLEGVAKLLAVSADGRTLAARGPRAIHLWDATTGARKRTLTVPDELLDVELSEELAVSADGRRVALAGNGYLFAWDCDNGKERLRRTHGPWNKSVALSPDGRVLAWGAMYKPFIHRWDLDAGRELLASPGHENHVETVTFSPDGQTVATGGLDLTVRLWKLNDALQGRAQPLVVPLGEQSLFVLGGQHAWSPDGKLLATVGPDETICLREAATGKPLRSLTGAKGCYALAFSPDGKLLAAGDNYYGQSPNPQGRVLVWETTGGELKHTFAGHGNTVRSVVFSPDSKRIASGSDGVRVWDLASGKQVNRLRGSRQFIDAMVFTRDGQRLVMGGSAAVVWDLSSGEEVRRLGGEHRLVSGVALSADNRYLATSGDDGLVRIWDFAAGTELAQLAGHIERVRAVAFSPDGKLLASAGKDTTVLLWDVASAIEAAAAKHNKPLAAADLARLWDDLGKADAPTGHKAIWTLVGQPRATVPLIEERLPKSSRPDSARIARLIKQLDDDAFAVRETALKELDKLGKGAVPALHEALRRQPSLEARRRMEDLLARHDVRVLALPAGDALRTARAIQVLELIGTPAARKVLETLTKQPPSRAAAEARRALERLAQRRGGER